jgi:hypothetical protein
VSRLAKQGGPDHNYFRDLYVCCWLVSICACRIVLLAVFEALQSYNALALRVNVAERPIHSAHSISLRDVGKRSLEYGPQGHSVIEGAVASGRVVEEGESVCKSELAVLDILVLPDPPDTIDLAVVNCICVRYDLLVAVVGRIHTVEIRVRGRVEEVGAGVAANAVMAC